MAKQLQLRRGTTAQHSTFTGLVGEVTVDTDKDTAVVHDGTTAGGKPLVTETGTQTLTNKTLTSSVVFPTGMPLQTSFSQTNSTYAVGSNQAATIFDGGYITAKQANSTYNVSIDCTVFGYGANSNPDVQDLAIQVMWGTTSSGSGDNQFGATHSHRFQTSTLFNTTVNFMSTDAVTHLGAYGIWSGGTFSGSYAQALTVAKDQALYWRVKVWAGSSTVYWNREYQSSTSGLGHTTLAITEVAN